MPSPEATVIVGLDADGIREAKRLASLWPDCARYVQAKDLALTLQRFCPLFVVVVSHDTTGGAEYYAMVEHLKSLKGALPIFVLAMCSSGVTDVFAGFTLAQRVSASLGVEVRATSRFLSFDEVGRGRAFAKSGVLGLILPTNGDTANTANLWGTVRPPAADSLDAFCLQFGDLRI